MEVGVFSVKASNENMQISDKSDFGLLQLFAYSEVLGHALSLSSI